MTTATKETTTMKSVEEQCRYSYDARLVPQRFSSTEKNSILQTIAAAVVDKAEYILEENKKDIAYGHENNLNEGLIDRLTLNKDRLEGISKSILEIVTLDDPVGTVLEEWTRPNGLHIKKVRVPLGVFGMIYEARPNVTADAIAIAIKTGNALVLRGSASAYNSNFAITKVVKDSLNAHKVNHDFIQLLEDTNRESVKDFVQMKQYLSLVIPRGSAGLIQHAVNTATVPCIETGAGICHVYIDKDADLDKAVAIADNAKTHRPSVCNACETLLVHKDVAQAFLPKIARVLKEKSVELRVCEAAKKFLNTEALATDEDWATEYNDLILSIKVVESIEEAIEHIARYSTTHTESIVSENQEALDLFTASVDSSSVFTNASTRFADGGEYGFGAEIGISTQKLHARGPMGIKELSTYKFIVTGNGQIR